MKYENNFAFFSDICWIRLDFDTFELASQTSERSNIDSFEMKESESLYNYPVLAGSNSGQHGKPKSIMCRQQQHSGHCTKYVDICHQIWLLFAINF